MLFRARVSLSVEGAVADVRLTSPDRRNALDRDMFCALADCIAAVRASKARVAVISGEGPAFCAGLDRAMFGQMLSGDAPDGIPADLVERTHDDCNLPQHVVLGWQNMPIPVIAAIHGAALGGGLQLALGADIRFVAPDARLALLEIRWGLVPDMAAIAILPSCVRDDVLRDLLYSGRIVRGDEAVRIGLATYLAADPLEAALIYARDVATRSPSAIHAAKRLANTRSLDRSAVLLRESIEQQQLIGGDDQRSAAAAAMNADAKSKGIS
ncbi:crotonase/enoyl-CoA hydratase family protein [Sphingobium sp. 3R8]|uniref:crotonase/enoyl-CoA hydratase family protein n=1 Tax=Sphingobium sp. 3R8 TaxID=2874921 RepID=UPI001CCA1E18|nr:crotonase/enoyl-CoA hydratase family protein [Sphingobium sp. 3R8]MBZ9646877.1 crotonase/enoyl-CoA hydratase family protein [Sphingobium sp. 3R8]